MSWLPKINMRRTLLIARRDYLGYIKTWGFWISFFLPFIFGVLAGAASQLNVDFSPPKYETILDNSGIYGPAIRAKLDADNEAIAIRTMASLPLLSEEASEEFKQSYETGGIDAATAYLDTKYPGMSEQFMKSLDEAKSALIFVDPPSDTLDGLTPYLTGEKTVTVDGQSVPLNGALIIQTAEGEAPQIQYWSPSFNNPKVKRLAEDYFRDQAELRYLASGELTPEGLRAARRGSAEIEIFDPTKSSTEEGGQAVSREDQIPYFVALILASVLWLTVFSGAYMLLTSMLEEKLNKLLEMMLASTRFSEIILGKLLGVAALTITAMAPYIIIGIAVVIGFIFVGPPDIAAGLMQSFTPKIIIFFVVFLVLGYIFYGAFFIALGAMSQSMQDAQTLTTPIVLVLTLCVLVVPIGFENPDSPIIRIASMIPFSAPFASIVRLPSDPPLWELVLSASVLALLCLGVILMAGRVFRYGVLSGSGAGAVKAWFRRTILRRG
ncbi:ABC transporter permease [Litorimonas sp. RW-G-Af-16]|uniref:ABC transporter permease n=1 Tax=Litorimonas sp. RW-G-Af-16 TaxID=3241168 RepID=UPI00390C8962